MGCVIEIVLLSLLFSFHATGSFLFFTFVVQLWITTVSYKLWRLLAPVAPERARALANGTVRARTSLVLFWPLFRSRELSWLLFSLELGRLAPSGVRVTVRPARPMLQLPLLLGF